MNEQNALAPLRSMGVRTDGSGFPIFEKNGEPDWHELLNTAFALTVKLADLAAHNADPNAHGGLNFDDRYAPTDHLHEIADIAGLTELLAEYKGGIDQLRDLLTGDMPGAIIHDVDFSTLEGVTIRDGVWSPAKKSIEA